MKLLLTILLFSHTLTWSLCAQKSDWFIDSYVEFGFHSGKILSSDCNGYGLGGNYGLGIHGVRILRANLGLSGGLEFTRGTYEECNSSRRANDEGSRSPVLLSYLSLPLGIQITPNPDPSTLAMTAGVAPSWNTEAQGDIYTDARDTVNFSLHGDLRAIVRPLHLRYYLGIGGHGVRQTSLSWEIQYSTAGQNIFNDSRLPQLFEGTRFGMLRFKFGVCMGIRKRVTTGM